MATKIPEEQFETDVLIIGGGALSLRYYGLADQTNWWCIAMVVKN